MDPKDKRKKYGVTMQPIPCTEAYRREMPFDHKKRGMVTWSYILVNRYDGTRVHVNIYDGETGGGHNTDKCRYPIKKWGTDKAETELRKSLRIGKDDAYVRCKISDCPVASLAPAPSDWAGPIMINLRFETDVDMTPEVTPREDGHKAEALRIIEGAEAAIAEDEAEAKAEYSANFAGLDRDALGRHPEEAAAQDEADRN